jgi:hypothetical protein
MTEIVLNGLVKRRAQLAGDIENTHEALRKMLLDLESLDAVRFDPDFQVETIKPKAFRPPKDWSSRGKMSRIILSVLRQAAEPLTTRDVIRLLGEQFATVDGDATAPPAAANNPSTDEIPGA